MPLGPRGITQLLLGRLIFVFEGQFVEIGLVAVLLVCRPRYRDGNSVVFNLSRLICVLNNPVGMMPALLALA